MVQEPTMRTTGLRHPLLLDGTHRISSLEAQISELTTRTREPGMAEACIGDQTFLHASTRHEKTRRTDLEGLDYIDTATGKQVGGKRGSDIFPAEPGFCNIHIGLDDLNKTKKT